MNIKKIVVSSIMSFYLTGCYSSHNQKKITWNNNQQVILVISEGWNANSGKLYTFEYHNNHWLHKGEIIPVSIGKNGSAVGEGLYPLNSKNAPYKKEGDMRSPAGIFRIGYSFGYANKMNTTYPYKIMSSYDYCIDNSQSSYYNQIINIKNVDSLIDYNSTEPMRRDIHLNGDKLYKLGFVIQYNPNNIPQAGSCIFAHLRTDIHMTTAGCTAMDEKNMIKILNWLNIKQNPIFILLPINIYKQKIKEWCLPKIS